MLVRLLPLALVVAFALPSCKKKKPNYDRSTPVATINSFRKALEKGRIPADISEFFLGHRDKKSWELRCKDKGCERARFEIDEVVSEDDYAAKYIVTYAVYGKHNRRIMGGKKTPMTFANQDGIWYFDQIGIVHTIKLGQPKDAGPTPSSNDGGSE